MALLSVLWDYAVPALILLTVLVFVHELGHYWVARRCGVRVEVFSIGFGPEIYGWTAQSGTRWKFSAVPLGGYVKMYGETEEPDDDGRHAAAVDEADQSESFSNKTLAQRAAVVVAGPAANFIFAIIIYAAVFVFIGQRVLVPEVGQIAEGSAAEKAGFQIGDVVKSIDGAEIDTFQDIGTHVFIHPGTTVEVVVDRDGREVVLRPTIDAVEVEDITGSTARVGRLGIEEPYLAPVVGSLSPGGVAERVGLREGDRFVRIGSEKIHDFEDIYRIVSTNPGVPLEIEVQRGNGREVVTAVPDTVTENANGDPILDEEGNPKAIGRLGISAKLPGELVKYDPFTAVWKGVERTILVSKQTLQSVGQIIGGDRSVKELGGPIRIAQISGEVARQGLLDMIFIAALLSVNLGLINLFPIPMLDGGHLLFYAIEAVRGRPLGERMREYGFRIGLALVLTLMLVVTWNDLARLPIVDFFVGLVT
jgi:regulator of sigma E protease